MLLHQNYLINCQNKMFKILSFHAINWESTKLKSAIYIQNFASGLCPKQRFIGSISNVTDWINSYGCFWWVKISICDLEKGMALSSNILQKYFKLVSIIFPCTVHKSYQSKTPDLKLLETQNNPLLIELSVKQQMH